MDSTFLDIHFKGNGSSPDSLRDLTGLPIEPIFESGETCQIESIAILPEVSKLLFEINARINSIKYR